jgi:tetratricopeptide (TPR) repeat protein
MSAMNLGSILSVFGRLKEAEPFLLRANALFEKLAREAPSDHDRQVRLAQILTQLGMLFERAGRPAEAAWQYQRAVAVHEKLALKDPEVEDRQRDLAGSRHLLAGHLYRTGRVVEAEHEYRQEIVLLERLTEPESRSMLASVLTAIPSLRLRDPHAAHGAAKEAVERRPESADHLSALGAASYRVGDWSGVVRALEKSMELKKDANPSGWFFLAMAYWQLGDESNARSWYEKAVQWMEKTGPLDEEVQRYRDEAATLLGETVQSTPTTKKEEKAEQRPNP